MAYTDTEARRLILEAGYRLTEEKLIARTWGNISARISGDEFIITPSGRSYDTLTEQDLVTVKIADCSYDSEIKPSSEKKVHAVAYGLRPEVNFVIHTHQFFATVVGAAGKDIPGAPLAEYGFPGSDTLRDNVAAVIEVNRDQNVFLMEKHGVLALGRDVEEAFELAEQLEERCRQIYEKQVPECGDPGRMDSEIRRILEVLQAKGLTADYNRDPYVMGFCRQYERLRAYLDDYAQILGPVIPVVEIGDAPKALKRYPAVMIRGYGAVCAGKDADDAEAEQMILSKNCAAALYAGTRKPIGYAEAAVQRFGYITKYSRQKTPQ